MAWKSRDLKYWFGLLSHLAMSEHKIREEPKSVNILMVEVR